MERREVNSSYSRKLFHDTGNSTKLINVRNFMPRGGFHF